MEQIALIMNIIRWRSISMMAGPAFFHFDWSKAGLSMDLPGRGRKLGVLGKLGNLGESVFRGFQLRVFHFALYPKRKTRR